MSTFPEHSDKILQHSSSLIFSKDHSVLCHSSKPIVYINSLLDLPLQLIHSVEYADDATLVRLYFSHKWYTSTNHTIDARESFFSSQISFDSLFWDVFPPRTLPLLDTNSTYVFLLKHPKHHYILPHSSKSLTLIDIIGPSNDPLDFHLPPFITNNLDLHPSPLLFIQSIPHRSDKRGLLFHSHSHKFLFSFPSFTSLQSLRGRTPSLLLRFCQLFFKPSLKKLFLDAFCKHNLHLFLHADKILHNLLLLKKFSKKSSPKHLFNLLQ